MATELARGLYRLDVPLPGNPLKNLNSYLLLSQDRNLLIDTGFNRPECREPLVAQLAELGVDMDRTDLFITHLHADHSGLGAGLVSPQARIYMGATEAPALNSRLDRSFWEMVEGLFVRAGFLREDLAAAAKLNPAMIYMPDYQYDYTCVEDGDTLKVGDRTLRCIETPGHTPGHICLYLEEEQILLSGDHILFDITPNISFWPELPNALARYLESLEKISALPVKTTYAAHRSAEGSLTHRIAQLQEHHKNRLEDALRIVREHPGVGGNLIASQMQWSIRAKGWDDFPLPQKWFAIGETAAHLDWLEEAGQLRKELDGEIYRYTAI